MCSSPFAVSYTWIWTQPGVGTVLIKQPPSSHSMGYPPVIRSLRLKFNKLKNSEVFGLICSLPLLEDLDLCSLGFDRRDEKCSTPSTSPKLTGSLKLWMYTGIQSVTRGLLALPNGIHFTKITVRFHSEEGVKSAMGLVSRCFDTLSRHGE